MQWLDSLPFWVLYIVIVACGLGALEAGYHFGRYWTQHSKATKKDSVDSVVAATLGLLAFLLVFMTGLANNRFDTRRQLVIAEANAVGTAYNWLAIGTVALLALFAVGFNDGLSDGRADGRALVAEVVLLLIFAAVLLLIVDLDRAGEGLLNVSQQALIDLQQQMQAGP